MKAHDLHPFVCWFDEERDAHIIGMTMGPERILVTKERCSLKLRRTASTEGERISVGKKDLLRVLGWIHERKLTYDCTMSQEEILASILPCVRPYCEAIELSRLRASFLSCLPET